MDALKKLGITFDEIEYAVKISFQTAIVVMGLFGNVHTIYHVSSKSKLPRATNTFIIALAIALLMQTLTACIDYANHLSKKEEYSLGLMLCDIWNTLNIYLPMLLALLCFFALMDRLVLLSRPELHVRAMSPAVVTVMVGVSFLLPLVVSIPPVYFQWYTTESFIRWRNPMECKFKTNLPYAIISPIVTFWIPLLMVIFIITKIFKTMDLQDRHVAVSSGASCEKLSEGEMKTTLPWKGAELQRQQRLALTLWSVYWNVTLFWIPQFVWQYIYKITGADWPRATNFMAWAGYMPSLVLPCLYHYYNIYDL